MAKDYRETRRENIPVPTKPHKMILNRSGITHAGKKKKQNLSDVIYMADCYLNPFTLVGCRNHRFFSRSHIKKSLSLEG